MGKRVFIIHGYTGNPQKNWFPWLKTELEKLGIATCVPAMPHSDAPQLREWLPYLKDAVGIVDKDTFFVGHSLGCPTILRFLERIDTSAGGALLVSGFAEPLPHLPQIDSFTTDPWDDGKIKQSAHTIALLHSDNDEAVPLEYAQRMQHRFSTTLEVMRGAGHINEKSGYRELPDALRLIRELMDL